MNKRKVPKIRFKGFHDDWEQRKLDEFVSFFNGLTYSPKDIQSTGTLVLRSSNVKDGEVVDADNVYVDPAVVDSENVRDGDIIVVVRNGSRALIGKHAEIKGSKPHTVIGAFMTGIRSEHPSFLNALLNTPHFDKEVEMNMGATINQITGYMFSKMEFMVPSPEEQDAIGEFFKQLDQLITLHQRKLEKLKIIKKSMLENCFPKNGEKAPKIRFSGFSDDWEQRKVGDYYDFKNGLNKGKEFFGEGTPIVNFTDVFHNRGIFPEMLSGKVRLELPEIKNYEVKKGDIFFTRTSETIEEIGYPSVMLGEPKNTVFSGFVLRGRCFLKDEPLDNLFKKYLFFTDAFRTEMLRKSSMTTRALTSGTAIKNMEFLHPSSKEEQHRIGEFLTKLDNLITLHQSKLEKMKMIKKSMLETMFV